MIILPDAVTHVELPYGCKVIYRKPIKPGTEKKVFGRYTQQELDAAFKLVKSKRGWKYPINAVVPADKVGVCCAAINYFGCGQVKTRLSSTLKFTRITAPGYYKTIGA